MPKYKADICHQFGLQPGTPGYPRYYEAADLDEACDAALEEFDGFEHYRDSYDLHVGEMNPPFDYSATVEWVTIESRTSATAHSETTKVFDTPEKALAKARSVAPTDEDVTITIHAYTPPGKFTGRNAVQYRAMCLRARK